MTDQRPYDDEIVVPLSAYEAERHQRAGSAKARKPMAFKRTSTTEIMETEYPEIRWTVPGYLAEGFSVLAGRQKLGKTWLAMDFAIAVATGGFALGSIECEEGDVLYCDLENGNRRIKRRIETLFPTERTRPDLSRLEWTGEAPALNAGFIECLEQWRISVRDPRLVVIDVLQRIKPVGSPGRNAYENDYAIFADLQRWATRHGVAVLGLHHTKKGGADDPLEALSGSNGLSAVADATLVLDRDSNGITLYVRGRDTEEKETALRFDAGMWSALGDAADVTRSRERVTISVTLEEAAEPLSPNVIADVTGMKPGNVRRLLYSMMKAGEARKIGRGAYIHPKNEARFSNIQTPGNDGNIGNNGTGSDV